LTHENYLEQLAALLELHPFAPGVRYLSILPTNHAIDFMVGFLGPYLCGAMVVHLRAIRPELVRDAFVDHRITHVALVPSILRNLEAGIRQRIASLPRRKRMGFEMARRALRFVSRGRPNARLGRRFLRPIHDAFGGSLESIFTGGAPADPSTLRFFHDLGINVCNGYGLTEAGTAVTLDRNDPPRPDTVGTPLPGVEIRIRNAAADGVGEVEIRSKTVMQGYLDDSELTRETLVDGWLRTGDLGALSSSGHLNIVGRRKNMIVTAGGKNVYPEDVERAFEGMPVQETCVIAAHTFSPRGTRDERLLLVVGLGPNGAPVDDVRRAARIRNHSLPEARRVRGMIVVRESFPRTASLKVKRDALLEQLRQTVDLERDVVDLREP
jgi:long-chain acyl-CoA synthetase